MKRIFLLALLLPLVSCLLPLAYAADGPQDLLVSGEVTLQKRNDPYIFRSIQVNADGHLVVDPGAKVNLVEGGGISVLGSLKVAGTGQYPIEFSGVRDKMWNTLTASKDAEVILHHVVFRNFSQTLVVAASNPEIHDILLQDGLSNMLQIGQSGLLQPDVSIRNITFRNISRGTSMGNEGLNYVGTYDHLFTENITFDDSRTGSYPSLLIGVTAIMPRATSEIRTITYSNGCRFTSGHGTTKLVVVVADLRTCPKNLPTLFVPGYGASMNLSKFIDPNDRVPTDRDWHFVPLLTQSYTTFLNALHKANITYAVAYYDWRLTSQEIVDGYLIPAIEKLKQQTGVRQVNIVAHSFGGVVSRVYLQGSEYHNDVAKFIEVGTPNLGAAKAYSVWEGGVLPDDWSALNSLVNFYAYQIEPEKLTAYDIIHRFFPSAREMFPNYPVVQQGRQVLSPEGLYWDNPTSENLLQDSFTLFLRTRVTTVFSKSEETLGPILVDPETISRPRWADGKPYPEQKQKMPGDGTVAYVSASLSLAEQVEVSGFHADLPAVAASKILQQLASQQVIAPFTFTSTPYHFFAFDCPVEVTITLPDGTKRSSTTENTSKSVGWVENNPSLLLIFLPAQSGEYQIQVRALADTPVRTWVDSGDITSFFLEKGGVKDVKFMDNPVVEPSPSPSASPTAPPTALPTAVPTVSAQPILNPSPSSPPSVLDVPVVQITMSTPLPFPPVELPPTLPPAALPFAEVKPAETVVAKPTVVLVRSYKKRRLALAGAAVILLSLIILLRRRRE